MGSTGTNNADASEDAGDPGADEHEDAECAVHGASFRLSCVWGSIADRPSRSRGKTVPVRQMEGLSFSCQIAAAVGPCRRRVRQREALPVARNPPKSDDFRGRGRPGSPFLIGGSLPTRRFAHAAARVVVEEFPISVISRTGGAFPPPFASHRRAACRRPQCSSRRLSRCAAAVAILFAPACRARDAVPCGRLNFKNATALRSTLQRRSPPSPARRLAPRGFASGSRAWYHRIDRTNSLVFLEGCLRASFVRLRER